MKCPNCNTVPMSFGWFLLLGWIHIRCRTCSSRLVLKSVGERFWRVLAGGAVFVAAIFLFLDYPYQRFGETSTTALFLVVIALTLFLAMYFAWKDSRFELAEHP